MKQSKNLKDILTVQESKAVYLFYDLLKNETKSNLQSILLFGSRARCEGNDGSDVDLLVLLNKEDYSLKIRIWDCAYSVFDKTEIMISPLVLSQQQFEKLLSHERLIAVTIQKEGIKI